MATYKIEKIEGIYITVTVSFQDRLFWQQLVTNATGDALEQSLQNYSDQYEKDWLNLRSGTDYEII